MGIMGKGMAANLAKSHQNVRVWNRTKHSWLSAYATECGVALAGSIKEAVANADVIFTCFTGPEDVKSVLFASDGVAACAKEGAIIVDCSTIGPTAAREIGQKLEHLKLNFLDAPVTGGDVGAKNGTLTFMVGGHEDSFKHCLPYFMSMGKRHELCGPVGSGQSVKLCNQVLCAVNLIAVSEALNLAKTLDVNPDLIIEVCGGGAGGSWSLTNLGPKILGEDYAPGFMVKDMLKDLQFVKAISPSLPGLNLAIEGFEKAKAIVGKDGDRLGTQVMAEAYGNRAKSLS